MIKSLKTFTVLSFSTLLGLAVNLPLSAKENKETKIRVQQPQKTEVSNLQKFTDAVTLRFVDAKLTEPNGQPVLTFRYQIENKSAKAISTLHWATYYTDGERVLLTQDLPIRFENGLKSKQSLSVEFSIPLSSLSEDVRAIMLDGNRELSSQYQAKSIEFMDNSKIVVEQ